MASNKKPHKRYVPRHINPLAYQLGMNGARQIDPDERRERMDILRGGVDAIAAATAGPDEWQRVFAVVNMLAAIGDLPGGPLKKAGAFISDVQDMVADVMDRIRATDSKTLYPEEITTLRSLETLWAEVLDVISCRELFQASERVSASYRRATSGQPPAGTRVVKGPWA
jgi:hypothetical protein